MEDITYKLTKNCLTIYNGYQTTDKKTMVSFISSLRDNEGKDTIMAHRTVKSMVREWRAHNLMYNLHLFRSHTQDVDIDNEPWYRRFVYFFLSLIY